MLSQTSFYFLEFAENPGDCLVPAQIASWPVQLFLGTKKGFLDLRQVGDAEAGTVDSTLNLFVIQRFDVLKLV